MAAYTDDFNRADANPIGGLWVSPMGAGMQIFNNQVYGIGAETFGISYYNNTFANDQYTQFVIAALTTSDVDLQLRCDNISGGNSVNANLYQAANIFTARVVNGVHSGTLTTIPWTVRNLQVGDTVRMEVVGNTYTVYNVTTGESHSFTDTSRTSGYAGFNISGNANTIVDDWIGGDMAGPPPYVPQGRRIYILP